MINFAGRSTADRRSTDGRSLVAWSTGAAACRWTASAGALVHLVDARRLGLTRGQIRGRRSGAAVSCRPAVPLTMPCQAWAHRCCPRRGLRPPTAAAPRCRRERTAVHAVVRPRRVLPQRRRSHGPRAVPARRRRPAGGLRLTSGAQTFLDLAALLPAPDLVCSATPDATRAISTADATSPGDSSRRSGARGRRRRWHRTSPVAPSAPESLMRYWLSTSDLPDPRSRSRCRPVGPEVAHADLGYAEWKVALEYEGRQHAEARAVRP